MSVNTCPVCGAIGNMERFCFNCGAHIDHKEATDIATDIVLDDGNNIRTCEFCGTEFVGNRCAVCGADYSVNYNNSDIYNQEPLENNATESMRSSTGEQEYIDLSGIVRSIEDEVGDSVEETQETGIDFNITSEIEDKLVQSPFETVQGYGEQVEIQTNDNLENLSDLKNGCTDNIHKEELFTGFIPADLPNESGSNKTTDFKELSGLPQKNSEELNAFASIDEKQQVSFEEISENKEGMTLDVLDDKYADSALAKGLPEWTIEPPDILVKRRHKK